MNASAERVWRIIKYFLRFWNMHFSAEGTDWMNSVSDPDSSKTCACDLSL